MATSSLRDTAAIVAHINKSTVQIANRFMTLIELINVTPQDSATTGNGSDEALEDTEIDPDEEMNSQSKANGSDRIQAAANSVRVEVEREALVRAVQDLLTLSRHMKELWVFGELDTIRDNHQTLSRVSQIEQDAGVALKGVETLLSRAA